MAKYDFGKTIGKFIKATLISAAVLIVGALLQGLTNYQPEGSTQQIIWSIGGASIIGLVTALLNWLKNKDNPN